MTSTHAAAQRDKIIEAAIRSYSYYGVQRATLADVAAEAGISRKTVYRFFADRNELLVAILTKRFEPIVNAMRERLVETTSLEEALVEGPIFVLHRLRDDLLYMDIVEKMTSRNVEQRLLRGTGDADNVGAVWRPLFKHARSTGELRSALSDDRLIEGVRAISGLLGLRMDLDEQGQRRFLQDFLVPAILKREADTSSSAQRPE